VQLLVEQRAGQVIAGTRSPEKLADLSGQGVVVRKTDFNDPQSLDSALAGVDRVLIISTDAIDPPGRRLAQHGAAVAAAAKAGVKHAVYTSMPNPDTSPVVFAPDHLGTERALASSGLSWTVLRNCWYTDFLIPTLAPAVASGKLIAATGQGAVPYVTREDCARAAAAVLASTDESNRTWNITGPGVVTFAELARLATELTGRPVTYVAVEPAERVAQLIGLGTPEPIAKMLVSGQTAIAQGHMGTATTAVLSLTGRVPLSVAEFLSARRGALLPATQTTGH
jgi:NAD(P)H dehydrogenase (quinone)